MTATWQEDLELVLDRAEVSKTKRARKYWRWHTETIFKILEAMGFEARVGTSAVSRAKSIGHHRYAGSYYSLPPLIYVIKDGVPFATLEFSCPIKSQLLARMFDEVADVRVREIMVDGRWQNTYQMFESNSALKKYLLKVAEPISV